MSRFSSFLARPHALFVGALLGIAAPLSASLAQAPQVEVLLGILSIFGFAVAVINGMLYKIVPFLAWFHLQAQLFQRVKVPNMKQLLPDACIRQQWWSYLAALLLLLAAAVQPRLFTYPAALAVGVAGGWLGINLLKVCRMYYRVSRTEAPSVP